MSLVIVGSIGLDTVKTTVEEHANLLGGSASYAAIAGAYYAPVQLVGIVGTDFPQEHVDFFKSRKIDLEGLQVVDGKTFRWSGEYSLDMNSRQTRSIELNVFEKFSPELPASYRSSRFALLGNIAPSLQLHVLDQLQSPHFVIADTMDLWIDIAKPELLQLIARVDMLILNDGEARQLTGENNLMKAGKHICDLGPRYVAIKKGEHGCLLFGKKEGEFFQCGAFPLDSILDPTGAGDTFAGGLAGFLAHSDQAEVTFDLLKKGVVIGSMLASFNVERFSMLRMKDLSFEELQARCQKFIQISAIGSLEV